MKLLRNLGRRKVRTTLTVLGITIGIWALVVFGSMANKIDALVAGGSTYYADKITLSDASGAMGGFSAPDVARDGRPGPPGRRRRRRRPGRDAADGRQARRRHHGRPADDHRRRAPAPTRAARRSSSATPRAAPSTADDEGTT